MNLLLLYVSLAYKKFWRFYISTTFKYFASHCTFLLNTTLILYYKYQSFMLYTLKFYIILFLCSIINTKLKHPQTKKVAYGHEQYTRMHNVCITVHS